MGELTTGKRGRRTRSEARQEILAAALAFLSRYPFRDFTGLLIPGGFMPDKLRRDEKVLELTQEFVDQRKLVAFICHGGWIPISAGILKGRRTTGSLGIKDDLENAGAIWEDEPVVVDDNLISSRTPRDLPAFAKAMLDYLTNEDANPTGPHVR